MRKLPPCTRDTLISNEEYLQLDQYPGGIERHFLGWICANPLWALLFLFLLLKTLYLIQEQKSQTFVLCVNAPIQRQNVVHLQSTGRRGYRHGYVLLRGHGGAPLALVFHKSASRAAITMYIFGGILAMVADDLTGRHACLSTIAMVGGLRVSEKDRLLSEDYTRRCHKS